MNLKSQSGQSLVQTMVAIGLIAILALISGSMVNLISQTLRVSEIKEKTVAVDFDLANLMVIPQMCTCNLRGIAIGGLNNIINIPSLRFFSDPPSAPGLASCNNAQNVLVPGQVHEASNLIVAPNGITLGPFHPLGNSGNFYTTLRVQTQGSNTKPSSIKLVVATDGGRISFCGIGSGPSHDPPRSPAAYNRRTFYRYTQYSLNFGCPNLSQLNGDPDINPHPQQSEPYVLMRNQYFWPSEEGSYFTEYSDTRIADTPVAPTNFSAFKGTTVCFEENGVGDNVRLILPSHNDSQCGAVTGQFLAAATVIDVGFSMIDHCRSRLF